MKKYDYDEIFNQGLTVISNALNCVEDISNEADNSADTAVPQIQVEFNETPDICASCGGRCCKSMSCEAFPQDIFGTEEPTYERLINFLKDGNWSIDCWEGDVRLDCGQDIPDDEYLYRCYYIRPRHVGVNTLFDFSYGGCCSFLTETGCSLSWEQRPTAGKSLKAYSVNDCHSEYGKKEAALAWVPYHDWFERIYDGESDDILSESGLIC